MPGLPIGTRVAGYRVDEEIADGVYRATQLALDRPVALKEVPGDDETLRAWQTAALLDHPHVVPVIEVVAHGDRFFVAMRYIQGGDIAAAKPPPNRAARLLEHVAGALGAAHASGLVHGDVKAEKVLVSGDGEHAYLTGFGGHGKAGDDLAALEEVGRATGAKPAPMPEPTKGEARRRGLIVIALATAITIVLATGLSLALRSTSPDQPHDALDGTPSARAIAIEDAPSGIAVGERRVWVALARAGAVTRLDPQEGTRRDKPIRVGPNPTSIAIGGGYVWVMGAANGALSRVDPGEGEVRGQPIEVGRGAGSVVYGYGSVWVADRNADHVLEIDPKRNEVERRIDVPGGVRGDLAVGEQGVWVANDKTTTITRIDPEAGEVAEPAVRAGGAIAVGEGALWVQQPRSKKLLRVDPENGQVTASFIGAIGDRVTVGRGAVWLLDTASGSLQRVDPEDAEPVGAPIAAKAGRGSGVVIGENAAWVFSPEANVVTRVGF